MLEGFRDATEAQRCSSGSVLISSGAPLAHEIQRWLTRVFGRQVVNGYGTTETGGLSSNGQIAAGARVRLLDCPAMGYTTADKPHPRGEV